MSQPKLLLLHGALTNKNSFVRLIGLLNDTFDIHSIDFSGHGNEPIGDEENFSIELFSQNVIDYLNKNNIDKINIFGYSMGGYIALYLCITHPERIEKIFTLGTKIFWTKEGAEKEIKMLDADKMLQKIPAFINDLKERHTKTDWKVMLQKTAGMMTDLGNDNLLTEEILKTIKHPVRIGIGDKDSMAGVEETVKVYRMLQNGQLHVFPDMLHSIEKINYGMVGLSVKDFMKQ